MFFHSSAILAMIVESHILKLILGTFSFNAAIALLQTISQQNQESSLVKVVVDYSKHR